MARCLITSPLPRGNRNKIWKATGNLGMMHSLAAFCDIYGGRAAGKGCASSKRFGTAHLLSQTRVSGTQRKETPQEPATPDKSGSGIRIADFERALFRRLEEAGFKKPNKFYWSAALVFVSVGAGYLYLHPNKLRQQVVEEVSTVASQSLEDEKIVSKAGQLTRDVLSSVLSDSATKAVASDFVKDVIVSDVIRTAAIGTIMELLNDPKVLELLRIRLSNIILNILQDDATRQIVLSQVNTILQHESVRASLRDLISVLTKTPEIQALMSKFFRDVLASDTVKSQGKLLGEQVTADVISSKEIQERAGNAIWSAVKFSIIPSMFRGREEAANKVEKEENQVDDTVNHITLSPPLKASGDTKPSPLPKKVSDDPNLPPASNRAASNQELKEGHQDYDRYLIDDDM